MFWLSKPMIVIYSNGPPKWIGLHRRITPLGDEFYSNDGCDALSDFNVRYWGGMTPYDPDGDLNTFCVYHETIVSPTPTGYSSKSDYTMADCSEKHQFYCQKEDGK